MKLTHFQLIHATDKQLSTIGVIRRLNAGWLKKTLREDFSKEQIDRFIAADIRKNPFQSKDRLTLDCEIQFRRLKKCLEVNEIYSAIDHAENIVDLLKNSR